MGDDGEPSRLLAVCDACEAVYAATETADGRIVPIGSRDGCRCGGTSFSRVDADTDESLEER